MEAYLASARVPSEPPITPKESLPVVPTTKWRLECNKSYISKTFSFADISLRDTFILRILHEVSLREFYVVDLDVTIKVGNGKDTITQLEKELALEIESIFKDTTIQLPSIYLHDTIG